MNYTLFPVSFLIIVIIHNNIRFSLSQQYINDNINVESTNPNDVGFYLFPNPRNLGDCDELIYKNISSVTHSRFNWNYTHLIILSHGYTQNYTSSFPSNVKDAYLESGFASHTNIIAVNWGKLARPKDTEPIPIVGNLLQLTSYRQAMDNVLIVGKRISDFLIFLHNYNFILSTTNIHLIGHSLGAHVSGMTGFYYYKANGGMFQISRITGTDPAFPGYQQKLADEKLDSSDAAFVDVIHTDQGEYGEYITLGHVDFFVNGGGPSQPECDRIKNDPSQTSCSHNLAPKYFAKSIKLGLINATKACPQGPILPPSPPPSCSEEMKIIFGEYCPTYARGSYGLKLSLN